MDGMMWLDDEVVATPLPSSVPASPQDQLEALKRELAEVRKELASKMVQLAQRDQGDRVAADQAAEAKAAELAAAAKADGDRKLHEMSIVVQQLEAALSLRNEELEDMRRLHAAQKRALKDALSAASERQAYEQEASDAGRTAASAAVEEELERLHSQLALVQTRADLEVRSKEAELQSLRLKLEAAAADREAAVRQAEQAAEQRWKSQLEEACASGEAARQQLEDEVLRLRSQAEDLMRATTHNDMAAELAALNKAKVQAQRELESLKDLAAEASRSNQERVQTLLEENASLKARIASDAARAAMAQQHASTTAAALRGKTFGAVPGGGLLAGDDGLSMVDRVIANLEGRRKGIVPLLAVASLLLLVLLIAIIRAAASTRGEHKGGLCFLAKLGINIGDGCGRQVGALSGAASDTKAKLGALLDNTPRVHDVPTGKDAAAGAGGLARRLLSGVLAAVVDAG